MEYMCKEDILLMLQQIRSSLETIIARATPIVITDDFTHSPDGMMRLDSICMLLVTIGEAIKNIDKYTHKALFPKYPTIDWRSVMGLRDIIAQQYFNIDAEIILRIVKVNVPLLQKEIDQIIADLEKEIWEDNNN